MATWRADPELRKQQLEFLALLRHGRKNAGLTQAELSRRLSQPQSYISKIERAERNVDVLELRRICAAMGIDFAEFARVLDERLRSL